ncbi:amino acid ABC transporter substrate-binding protein [Leucobacter sp. CSA2]|uniref:Amino acid ABC transporter substrate-binding protein n=1 Tax=Leucobacter edaphi TaxID=2796472 RepID=A0A934UXI3_9MICO|nr:transporter substrate-binding domain-containing protein [Leucobacter edaphi]MBK0422045.1 amino acid ABC transporter substrate-binding protein [Leucobacter edaphi]
MKPRALLAGLALAALAVGTAGCAPAASGGASVPKGCKPADTFSTVAPGTLTVSLYSLPPFVAPTNDGGIEGVDADILESFAAKECLTITPAPVATAAVIPAVQGGRADVAAGAWWRSADRAKVVALTEPVYLDEMAVVSSEGLDELSQLRGKRVGTVDGYLWVKDAKAYLQDGLKVYKSANDMYQDLKVGRITIALDGYGDAPLHAPDRKVKVIKPDPAVAASLRPPQTCYPVSLENAKLLDALNTHISEMKGSGELKKILKKHGLPGSSADTGDAWLVK